MAPPRSRISSWRRLPRDVARVSEDHPGLQGRLVGTVCRVLTENQDQWAHKVLQRLLAQVQTRSSPLNVHVKRQWVRQVLKVHLAPTDRLDLLGKTEKMESPVTKAHAVHLAYQASRDNQVAPDLRENQELTALRLAHREDLALQAGRDHLDSLDPQESPEMMDQRERTAHRVLPDHLDSPEQTATLARMDDLENPARLELAITVRRLDLPRVTRILRQQIHRSDMHCVCKICVKAYHAIYSSLSH
jgi:hypothetical protein